MVKIKNLYYRELETTVTEGYAKTKNRSTYSRTRSTDASLLGTVERFSHLFSGFENQLDRKISIRLSNQSCFPLGNVQIILLAELQESLTEEQFSALHSHVDNLNIPMFWAIKGFIADYCISVLNCHYDRQKWKALQLLIKDCGLFFPYDNPCLICDRPRILCFDDEKLPHAEGKPAIQFADGFSVYAHHGARLTFSEADIQT